VRRQSPPLSNSHVRALRLPNAKAEAIASALHMAIPSTKGKISSTKGKDLFDKEKDLFDKEKDLFDEEKDLFDEEKDLFD
jgi:hypothetical protein